MTRAADFRWSSYRTYLGHRRAPVFLNTEVILTMFDHDPRQLARYTEEQRAIDLSGVHAVTDLLQLIEFEVGRHWLLHDDDSTSNAWRTRSVLVLLMDTLSDHHLGLAIEQHLAFPNRAARAKAISRAHTRTRSDAATAWITSATLAHIRTRVAA